MCNSLTRTEVLEIAFKLIKDTDTSNSMILWSFANANAIKVPKVIPMGDLVESKPPVCCDCRKCHERKINESEIETGVLEVIAYLDKVLEEFGCYFYQTQELHGDRSTLLSEREYNSPSPSNLLIEDDCTPSNVVCNSIDSPPCNDDEVMTDYAIQESSRSRV
ncbi:conserved hypothetical protein [Echinococcus multilocularis]|uniref:Uncharacterized protein n=1 Tax=Echinococcus multilocularis TaxID=6211 RepID=A0A068YCK3_ECHMU|nr:conserved hypothetical protein [Echinococcus multilocularis]